MTELVAARASMAFSLGFHIIFAAIGMVMPFLMSFAHYKYLKTEKREYLALTKMWMKGVAILFAVGAVSGTVLAFELGLLWPGFMEYAGPIIGMPFSWEGTAFFLEAVAIGLFLYGWNRMHPWLHWCSGLLVGLSGFASGIFVLAANSWMNSPAGFDWINGQALNIDPVAAMFNKAWLHQAIHMQVAAIQSVGFGVAGVHAFMLLRGKAVQLNIFALKLSLLFACLASLVQPFIGHFAAQKVATLQPAKLAAMEAHYHTEKGAGLYIGGIPDSEKMEVEWGVKIPKLLSFLIYNDFNAEVAGLDQVPREEWPNVPVVHISFQIMVAIGSLLALLSLPALYCVYKNIYPRWLLLFFVLVSPLGFIAIEAGWIVTEVGRQPWIIYGFLRTKDALTPVPGMIYHFYLFLLLYVLLTLATIWIFSRQIFALQEEFTNTEKS